MDKRLPIDKGHYHVGYTKSFIDSREEEARQLAEQQAANQADNARARREYDRRLEAEQKAKREAFEDEIDERLAEDKTRLRREWLAEHPDQTSQDFERKGWRHLRENLKAELKVADQTATHAQLVAAGIYGDGF